MCPQPFFNVVRARDFGRLVFDIFRVVIHVLFSEDNGGMSCFRGHRRASCLVIPEAYMTRSCEPRLRLYGQASRPFGPPALSFHMSSGQS